MSNVIKGLKLLTDVLFYVLYLQLPQAFNKLYLLEINSRRINVVAQSPQPFICDDFRVRLGKLK